MTCEWVVNMESLLKKELHSVTCRALGGIQGCISNGESYELDNGRRVFVKHNDDQNVSTGWYTEVSLTTPLLIE